MSLERVHAVTLACHASTPDSAVRGIEARVRRRTQGALAVSYFLQGTLDRLRLPVFRAPRIADRLWEHTCFEIFIRVQSETSYHEFNLAPSGEWAAYRFERYREGGPFADDALAPQITVRSAAEKFELEASIRLDRLSAKHARGKLSLALSAVVEDNAGALSYWALKHPAVKPDFHHPDAFVLELDEVRD